MTPFEKVWGHIQTLPLEEEALEYLLGRGAKRATIADMRICSWKPLDYTPEGLWDSRLGSGEDFTDWICVPIFSPAGDFLGFDLRGIYSKEPQRFVSPEAKWTPVFLGRSNFAELLWNGGNAWIVEGLYDLLPLEWAIPETDAILATGRARLSKLHIEFLYRYCRGVVRMCYDNDEAGKRATFGGFDKTGVFQQGALFFLKKAGLQAYPVVYPGKDPGVIWDKSGADGIRAVFSKV